MTQTVSEQKGFGAYTCDEGAYNGSDESEVAVHWGGAYLDSQMWLLDGEFSGDEKNPWLGSFSF